MEFPITELLNDEASAVWLEGYFHPEGLKCPQCGAGVSEARCFRRTKRSQLTVYRCQRCEHPYNLYSGTVLQQRHLRPAQVLLLLRGVLKGEPTTTLSRELGLAYQTVWEIRRDLHDNARWLQPTTPLEDTRTETDEMFQNAGEKRYASSRPR